MSDIQSILRTTLETFQNAKDDKKVELASKLGLVIEALLTKFADFSDIPEQYLNETHPHILAHIDAIDKKTEDAVDEYLSVSERLGKIVKDAPEPIKKAVQAEINIMFEASNFQDLVSQHANEIRLLGEDTKADMTDMQAVTGGGDGSDNASKPNERSRNKNKRADNHLLNGPAISVSKDT